jgi:hypothetical protein
MDYEKAIKEKKSERSDLHKRMDDDADLVNLAQYELKGVDDRKTPDALSVTLNDPAVFAANVESALGSAVEQITVESEDEKLDTAYIEDAVRAGFSAANFRLMKQGRYSLNPYFDQSLCRRGRGAARCLFRIVKDSLIADITPWDPRYVYYDMGVDGLSWAAYETTRTKAQILAEYPEVAIRGKTATVIDVWDAEHNEIWIDGKKHKEQRHSYGYPPIAIQLVPMGSMLVEDEGNKYEGESIFFLIRDLIPELNRLVSIIQTLNQRSLDPAYLYKSKEGKTATPPDAKAMTAPGSVTSIDVSESVDPVLIGQLRQQAWLAHSAIETRIQRGSLSNFEYGTFTQPMSAVALITIGEGRDQVFLPRLGARGFLNQQLAYMLIDQITKTGERSVEIGERGHKRTFEVSKLQGEYDIEFKYFVKSPKIDLARYSMAAAAGDLISEKTKRREILQLEDPEGEERLLAWQNAGRLSPLIEMHRTIMSLLDMAERGDEDAEVEAEILARQMGLTLEQIARGELPETLKQKPTEEKPTQPQPLMPLFGKETSSAKKAAELQGTPRGEE